VFFVAVFVARHPSRCHEGGHESYSWTRLPVITAQAPASAWTSRQDFRRRVARVVVAKSIERDAGRASARRGAGARAPLRATERADENPASSIWFNMPGKLRSALLGLGRIGRALTAPGASLLRKNRPVT